MENKLEEQNKLLLQRVSEFLEKGFTDKEAADYATILNIEEKGGKLSLEEEEKKKAYEERL